MDLQLAAALRPSALTYEHIPRSIAFNPGTAPRNMTLLGYVGPPPPTAEAAAGPGPGGSGAAAASAVQVASGQRGVVLGSFAYDFAGPAVQTFALAGGGDSSGGGGGRCTGAADGQSQASVVDHVRLVINSNYGNPEYTCVYRIRVHGTPVGASGSGAATAASSSDQ